MGRGHADLVPLLAAGVAFYGFLALFPSLRAPSGGMSNLMTAISTAYDEEEKRSFIKKRLLALSLTLGTIAFLIVNAIRRRS